MCQPDIDICETDISTNKISKDTIYFEKEYRIAQVTHNREIKRIMTEWDNFKKYYLDLLLEMKKMETDITSCNMLSTECIDGIIGFDKNIFLSSILDKINDEQIIRQFSVDFYRVDVHINGTKMETIEECLLTLSQYNRMIDISPNNKISLLILSLQLISQTSCYLSFAHLHQKMEAMKNQYGEMADSLYVMDNRMRNVVELEVDDKRLQCVINATYRLVDIKPSNNISFEGLTLHNIDAKTVFSINSDNCLLIYKCI